MAALDYVEATTSGEQERTRAVSLVGAAQAVALMIGPGLGGTAVVDLPAPVHVAPVLLELIAAAVVVLPPPAPQAKGAVEVGASGVATGVVLVLMQVVVVPRLVWGPSRLLRAGAPIAGVGYAVPVLAPGFRSMTGSMMVLALGLGTVVPGHTAGPSLQVPADQQGQIAGLVNATTVMTFIIGR